MPPEASPQPDPEAPKTDFGFMMDQQQPPPASPGAAGKFNGFGKLAKIAAVLLLVFVVVIIAALVFSGGGDNSSKQVLDLMAQNQEVARVSFAQDQKFTDGDTKGLSATTQAAMNSQRLELAAYLAKTKYKYSEKELAAKANLATDAQLATAAQNNGLDDAYALYLRTSLKTYSNSLSATFKSADSSTLKATLQSAYDSVQTLLASPQLRS